MNARPTRLVLALAVLAVPAAADTYDVHPGDSIQDAVDASSPGDTVRIHKGVYQEIEISVVVPGLTILGDGSKTIMESHGEATFGVFADGVTIRKITFVNASQGVYIATGVDDGADGSAHPWGPPAFFGDGTPGDAALGVADVVIRDNSFISCTYAIYGTVSGNSIVTRNLVDGGGVTKGNASIYLQYAGFDEDSLLINRNQIRRLGIAAVFLDLNQGHATISSNRIDHCGSGIFAIAADPEADVPAPAVRFLTVERNQVADSNFFGILVQAQDTQVRIERNTAQRNGSGGLIVASDLAPFDDASAEDSLPGLVLERNRCDDNFREGIAGLFDAPSLVADNRAEGNLGQGIAWRSSESEVRGNRCRRNRLAGLSTLLEATVGLPDGASGLHSLLIADNRCESNGRDGIYLLDPTDDIDTGVVGNRCRGNRGDGIDVKGPNDGGFADEVEVADNRCDGNGHQGINNSGTNTDIRDNSCSGNGRGAHPDIAGAGDGTGTVGDFDGNSGTGGTATEAEVDLPPYDD